MGNISESIEKILDTTGDLLETQKELTVLKFKQQATASASVAIIGIICLVAVVCVLIFSGFGLAWWIGDSLGDLKMGFLIVSGAYAVVLTALLLSARKVLFPLIRNKLIEKMYEED
jgi:uncharacterized membrane protein